MVSDRPNKKPAPATRPEQAAGVITKTEYHELATKTILETDERGADRLVIYAQTDYGNCRRLADRHGHLLRYVSSWEWLVWDGTRWKRDKTDEVMRRAKETVSAIQDLSPLTRQEDLARHARNSQAIARLQAMIKLAQSEPEIVATPDEFDTDPWLLNVNNGTIDLRTGGLSPHRREDLITKLAPVEYDPAATCPLWMKFLERIMDGNHRLIDYLKRTAGYSLTGDNSEDCLIILYGLGKNGKTVYSETQKHLLGDYAMSIPVQTLLDAGRATNSDTHFALARLKTARLVIATETAKRKKLDEALVKALTGGDTIVARHMYKDFFEFRPQFKIFLSTNHRPVVKGTETAIWERLRLIPFTVFIPKEERDKKLREKLRGEFPGILAWAVQGCLEWQELVLGEPKEVSEATDEYRQEMDVTGTFVKERCVLGARCEVSSTDLYKSYKSWCKGTGEKPLSRRDFGMELAERGFEGGRYTSGKNKGKKLWRGIRLRSIRLKGASLRPSDAQSPPDE